MPKAYASTVLNTPAKEVWAVIRDFNALPVWHPGVADSMIEDGKAGDQVGAVRNFHLKDGAHLRERLLSHSDVDRHYSYNFEKTPFSVANYHATLRVTPVTDGHRAFVEWWTTFDCGPEKIDDWVHTFAGMVFKGGLDALKGRFGG
jgi:Polyketide cyclase / dehydrase and lipid transport